MKTHFSLCFECQRLDDMFVQAATCASAHDEKDIGTAPLHRYWRPVPQVLRTRLASYPTTKDATSVAVPWPCEILILATLSYHLWLSLPRLSPKAFANAVVTGVRPSYWERLRLVGCSGLVGIPRV